MGHTPVRLMAGRACAVLCLMSWAGALLLAQQGLSTYEQITVGATAVAIASATTNPTGRSQMNTCFAQADQIVRWRTDGTAPTATVGASLTPTTEPVLLENNAIARAFRVISTSAFNAVVNVTCYP